MKLLNEIKNCTFCSDVLPLEHRPVVSFSKKSKIIIVGQAPGLKVHESGIPWDDASGKRLREWLNVSEKDFYNTDIFGIVPMGFCYPGRGKSGDLPPRPECSALYMDRIFNELKNRKLVLLIGQYAQRHFLDLPNKTLTDIVRNYKNYLPEFIVLPHPSPRNNIWLKKNQWFERDNLTYLRKTVQKLL